MVTRDGVHHRPEDRDADRGADDGRTCSSRWRRPAAVQPTLGLGHDQRGCRDPAHAEADQQAADGDATTSRPGPSAEHRAPANASDTRAPGRPEADGQVSRPDSAAETGHPSVSAASANPLTIGGGAHHSWPSVGTYDDSPSITATDEQRHARWCEGRLPNTQSGSTGSLATRSTSRTPRAAAGRLRRGRGLPRAPRPGVAALEQAEDHQRGRSAGARRPRSRPDAPALDLLGEPAQHPGREQAERDVHPEDEPPLAAR